MGSVLQIRTFKKMWLVIAMMAIAATKFSGIAVAQTTVPPEQALAGLDADVQRAMVALHVPGASIGIIVHGKGILAKGYGVRDVTKPDPVDADTVFDIGSMTKSFTAMTVAAMVDDRKLEWDKPIVSYVPWFRLHDAIATQLVTPKDLLSHRTGMASHDFLRVSTYLTREELLHRIRYLEPNLSFRQGYQYNNLMYVVAGYVAGNVAGKTWEDLVRQRIFLPLGMTSSSASAVELQNSINFAHPHELTDGRAAITPIYDYQKFGVGPNGAVNSSANDMLKYLAFHLSNGTVDGKQVLSGRQLQMLHEPSELIAGSTDYALGWVVEAYRGHRVLQHGGSVHGFTSHMILMPDDGIAIVVLNNLASDLPRTITSDIRDRLLGVAPEDYLGEVLTHQRDEARKTEERNKAFENSRLPETKPTLPLSMYAGTYFHPAYGEIHVRVEDSGLKVQFDAYQLQLRHYRYDTFEWDQHMAQFHLDPLGKVIELLLPLEPSVKALAFAKQVQ